MGDASQRNGGEVNDGKMIIWKFQAMAVIHDHGFVMNQ